jgi:hypothetical protein
MKSRIAIASALLGTLVASPAFAQESTIQPPTASAPAAAVEQAAQPAKKLSLGAQLELLPGGSVEFGAGGQSQTFDLETAFGLSAVFGVDITPNISIGAAPRVIFGIKGDDSEGNTSGSAFKELDLRGRAAVHGEIAPAVSLYGFVEPGYSWITNPDKDGSIPGVVIAFGAGATYDVSSALFLSGELGYQIGFQGEDLQGQHIDEKFDFFHLGFGAGTRF